MLTTYLVPYTFDRKPPPEERPANGWPCWMMIMLLPPFPYDDAERAVPPLLTIDFLPALLPVMEEALPEERPPPLLPPPPSPPPPSPWPPPPFLRDSALFFARSEKKGTNMEMGD